MSVISKIALALACFWAVGLFLGYMLPSDRYIHCTYFVFSWRGFAFWCCVLTGPLLAPYMLLRHVFSR